MSFFHLGVLDEFSPAASTALRKTTNTETTLHLCDKCSYVASSQEQLRRHSQFRHAGIMFSCDLCFYRALSTNDLHRHRETQHIGLHLHHQASVLCTAGCEKVFNTIKQMKKHTRFEHKYQCSHCLVVIEGRSALLKHLRRHTADKESTLIDRSMSEKKGSSTESQKGKKKSCTKSSKKISSIEAFPTNKKKTKKKTSQLVSSKKKKGSTDALSEKRKDNTNAKSYEKNNSNKEPSSVKKSSNTEKNMKNIRMSTKNSSVTETLPMSSGQASPAFPCDLCFHVAETASLA